MTVNCGCVDRGKRDGNRKTAYLIDGFLFLCNWNLLLNNAFNIGFMILFNKRNALKIDLITFIVLSPNIRFSISKSDITAIFGKLYVF